MPSSNLRSLPVYRKSLSLCKMSREIARYFAQSGDMRSLYKSDRFRDILADALLTDAILIPQQIVKAERSRSYAVRMNSASLVNIMLRNLLSYCNGLEKDGVKEKEFLDLLRAEIRSFRKAYKKWRKSIGYGGRNAAPDIDLSL